jgi:lipopolysaccharide export system permease protein
MPRLSTYVLRQLIGPTALFTLLLTAVVWLTQSLRLLDLVINRGQSAPTFLYLSILVLPSLLVIILPIAFFSGALYGLSRLNSDSELVVMGAAGFSRGQLAGPVLVAAALTMGATYLCGLYLMPAGQRAMQDKVLDIRADVGAALLNEGQFNIPTKGLTVFIRELNSEGQIRGVLVHNERDPQHATTYLAERGVLAQTPAGARLIMFDGTVEQGSLLGARLSVLKFKSYVFDLDQLASPRAAPLRATSERYLNELLWPPDATHLSANVRKAYLAEAHNRLGAPLYCLAFGLIAFAAVVRGRRTRGANFLRVTVACLAVAALRISGYGIQGLASRYPLLNAFFYVIPAAGAVSALVYLMEVDLRQIFQGIPPPREVAA